MFANANKVGKAIRTANCAERPSDHFSKKRVLVPRKNLWDCEWKGKRESARVEQVNRA